MHLCYAVHRVSYPDCCSINYSQQWGSRSVYTYRVSLTIGHILQHGGETFYSYRCNLTKITSWVRYVIVTEIETWQRGDEANKIHVISPDQPEECIALTTLSVSFNLL